MQRLRVALVIAFIVTVPFALAQATTDEAQPPAGPVLIVELQTASAESADDEFVELYNRTDEPVEGKNLKLQYRSATGADWTAKATLEGTLQPRGRYLIATSRYAALADITRGLGLAAGGGHLRVVVEEGIELSESDQVAWGTAAYAVIAPALAPDKSQSLKRAVNEDGQFTDTNNDSLDFVISLLPTPERSLAPTPPPPVSTGLVLGQQNSPSSAGNSTESTRSGPFARLELSELFIDPDKPLTDADDEFVEVYNPNQTAVNLEDYKVETGNSFSYDFTLPDVELGAGKYIALYSADTGLTLSNSGGKARLLDPSGTPIYEVPAYEKAEAGYSWAAIDGNWQWSSTPTPGEPNAAGAADGVDGSDDSNSQLVLGSALGAGGGTEGERTTFEPAEATAAAEVDTAVVAGVGSLALLYAGYEYRYDVANRFAQFKRYLASRRSGGQKP